MYTSEQVKLLKCEQCAELMLHIDDSIPQCINSSCRSVLRQTLLNWLDLQNVVGTSWDRRIINKLINERQVKSIVEIYRLNAEDFIFDNLIEQEEAERILSALNNSKNTSMKEVLFSLRIPFIGKEKARSLINKFSSIQNISKLAQEELVEELHSSDSGYCMALSIYSWFQIPQNRKLIEQLEAVGFPISSDLEHQSSNEDKEESRDSADLGYEDLRREFQTAIDKIESLNSRFIEHFQILRRWAQKNFEEDQNEIKENSEEAQSIRTEQIAISSRLDEFSDLRRVYSNLGQKITDSQQKISRSIEELGNILKSDKSSKDLEYKSDEFSEIRSICNSLDSKIIENHRQIKQWIDDLEDSLSSNGRQEGWKREFESLKGFLEERLVSSKNLVKEVSEEIQAQELFSDLRRVIDEFSGIISKVHDSESIQQKLQEIESEIKGLPTRDVMVRLLNLRHSELVGKLENIEGSTASLLKLSLLDEILNRQAQNDSRNSEISNNFSQVKESTNSITNTLSSIEFRLEEVATREQQSCTEIQNISQNSSSQNSTIISELSQIREAILSGNQNSEQLQQQLETALAENCRLHDEIYQISMQNSSLQSTLGELTNLLEAANLRVQALQEFSSLEVERDLLQMSQSSKDSSGKHQSILATLVTELLSTRSAIQQIQPTFLSVVKDLKQEKSSIENQLSIDENLLNQCLTERENLQRELQEIQVQLQQCQQQNLLINQEKLSIQSELERSGYTQNETQQRLEQVGSLNSDLQVQKNQIQQQLSSVEEQRQQISQQLMHSQDACVRLSQEKQNLQNEIEELKVQNLKLQQQLKDQETNWLDWLNQRIQQDQNARKKLIRYILSFRR